jgi:large subunit ribosomal protein L4
MAKTTTKNDIKKSDVTLDPATFGIQPNVPVMHQVVTAQLAARRAGTQSTKTRSEVRGGGAKPFRQKGTGNARQGTIRAPHYSGGGVALGPKPRSHAVKVNKKEVRLALRSALSDRAAEGKVVVIGSWGIDTPSTKAAKAALAGLGVGGKVLVVVGRDDAAAALSFRNLPNVQLIAPGELNAYDVLVNEWIVFTEDVLPSGDSQGGADAPAKVQAFAAVAAPDTETAADDTADDDTAADDTAADEPAWVGAAGSVVAPDDGSEPEGYPIKGNANSMLYHVPGSAFYERTDAEVWFDTEESAEAAGFEKPPSQRDEEETEK